MLIEVTDDGAGLQAGGQAGGGHGLAGMRERAALFGGELAAGPRPGGGFGVRARLPLDEQARPGLVRVMSPAISVLIADDQDLVREGLRMLLEAEPGITVAARQAPAPRRSPPRASSIPTSC